MTRGDYPLDSIYQIIVGHYNIQPSEYWGMTMAEVENIHEARRSKMIGNMHESEYLELEQRREEAEAQGITVM